MKQIFRFSKFFLPAAIISITLAVFGISGYFIHNGFNLGVDFQAGLLQEIQFAPTALRMTYNGRGIASISVDRANLTIVISGVGIDEIQHDFPYSSYGTIGELVRGLSSIEGLQAEARASNSTRSSSLLQSAQNSPQLGSVPYVLHHILPDADPIQIDRVRSSLSPLGTVSVQVLGEPSDRRFMIRMEDSEISSISGGAPAEMIIRALESTFGQGEVAVTRSDYVGSRFSKNLTDQIGILVSLTLLLVLVYMTFRFKLQYAIGAVIGIVYDALIIVSFVVWTRMEFNTTTIAAILTIVGYSVNNTIVVFDRVRENLRIYADDPFVDVLNRSLTATLSRTIITTLTTMLAVLSLFIFTTGSMKDFALALLVGLSSGVYTTMFIASGIVCRWENSKAKKEKQKLAAAVAPTSAKALTSAKTSADAKA